MVEAECSLWRERMEYDATHDRSLAIRQDYLAQLCASTTGRWYSLEFDRVLSRH
jgi:hypothetical protein